MKPGRVQNALKPFGRDPKCFIILRPDSKIQEILENVGSGLPKIAKFTKVHGKPMEINGNAQKNK